MQHLDDGVIHALLDGELTDSESDAIRDHVQLCPVCADRLAEERLIQAEAERMIAELDTPERPAEPALPPRTDESFSLGIAPDQPRSSGPPVVLMPQRDFQRSRLPRVFGWAATLLVAAGAGYFASVARQSPPAGVVSLPELEPQSQVPAAPAGADSAAFAGYATPSFDSTVVGSSSAGSAADSGAGKAVAQDVTALMDSAPLIVEESQSEREPPAAAAENTEERDRAAEPDRLAQRRETPARTEARTEAPADADVAAAARAPAVAAKIDTPVPAPAPPVTAPAASIRPPRTALEEQAQIRMRIGLDETRRMLGSGLHVIDGLQPQLVGLVDGRLVQGADPNAPVVRVVYLDEARRAIYLDQQRLDLTRRQTGAARDTIPPDWVKGDVWLSLKGDVSGEELAALARRVR
jgi:hypothetical protein